MVYVIGATSNTPDHLRNTTQFSMLRNSTGRVFNKTPLTYRGSSCSRRASMIFVTRKYNPVTGKQGGFQGSKEGSDIVAYKKMVQNLKFVNSCKQPNAKNCGGDYLFIRDKRAQTDGSILTCAAKC